MLEIQNTDIRLLDLTVNEKLVEVWHSTNQKVIIGTGVSRVVYDSYGYLVDY